MAVPGSRLILAHAHGPSFPQLLVWVLRKVGTDRVIFGSDYPLGDPLQAVQAVNQLGFNDSELEAIVHGNAAELINK